MSRKALWLLYPQFARCTSTPEYCPHGSSVDFASVTALDRCRTEKGSSFVIFKHCLSKRPVLFLQVLRNIDRGISLVNKVFIKQKTEAISVNRNVECST